MRLVLSLFHTALAGLDCVSTTVAVLSQGRCEATAREVCAADLVPKVLASFTACIFHCLQAPLTRPTTACRHHWPDGLYHHIKQREEEMQAAALEAELAALDDDDDGASADGGAAAGRRSAAEAASASGAAVIAALFSESAAFTRPAAPAAGAAAGGEEPHLSLIHISEPTRPY